MSAKSITLAFS